MNSINSSQSKSSSSPTSTTATSSSSRSYDEAALATDSSSVDVQPVVELINKKRGRKPKELAENAKDHLNNDYNDSTNKNQQEEYVMFGNKRVKKFSEEYVKLKLKNYEAVKRCRERNRSKKLAIDNEITQLDKNNQKLQKEIEKIKNDLQQSKEQIQTTLGFVPPDIIECYQQIPDRIFLSHCI
jgi:hypothetical protein